MKDGNGEGDGGRPARLDRYLVALTDRRRRQLLYYLSEHRVADLDELARYVAARQSDRPPSAVSERESDRTAMELHHRHVPRLADCGLVEYDERSGDVRLDDPPRAFTVLLRLCQLIDSGT